MKKIYVIALGLALSCNSSQKTTSGTEKSTSIAKAELAPTYAKSITEEELREHLFIYASDEFEGRETGEPGQKKAVDYLKKEYEKLGIPAAQPDGNYFQEVALELSKVPQGTMTIENSAFTVGEDILTFSEVKGTYSSIVYVGYGIEDEKYTDYGKIDVTDKIVLVKSGEPKNADGSYLISGTDEVSVWSNMSEALGKRSELAMSKGAKGMLYLDPDNFSRYGRYFQFMKTNDSGRMQLTAERAKEFMMLINEKVALAIYPDILEASENKLIDKKLDFSIESEDNSVESENVVAFIKGKTKPNEYVVLSSHLDHIGITGDGQINNGADDDGSGTVALLEIAEAFKKAADEGNGPDRSVVFLHVTGEEKGLLGSKYYTDYEPIFPLNETVANLNIDMIGRIDPKRTGDRNYIYLIGSDKLSTELHELSEEVNKKHMNIELDYTYNDENDPNRFYYRSDHYNFAKNNIPIIFYFNGTHADYHKPTDTPDKINYDLLTNRTQLVFYTAWEIANKENKLIVDKASTAK